MICFFSRLKEVWTVSLLRDTVCKNQTIYLYFDSKGRIFLPFFDVLFHLRSKMIWRKIFSQIWKFTNSGAQKVFGDIPCLQQNRFLFGFLANMVIILIKISNCMERTTTENIRNRFSEFFTENFGPWAHSKMGKIHFCTLFLGIF